MDLASARGRLCYCTNIHAGESWESLAAALRGVSAEVKTQVSPGAAMGIGLRVSAEAMQALKVPAARAELGNILAEQNFELWTINGFPYGPFHGQPVKQQVYEPDWRTSERLAYTNDLADLLAEFGTSNGESLSLSTVPGAFKPNGVGAEAAMAETILAQVAHNIGIRERTGKTIALALEPEPCCFLETIEESVEFFAHYLFSEAAAGKVAELAGVSKAEAAAALPRHLGLCYDVCHAAVEFEDPAESVAMLRQAGVPIHKLQLSAALRLPQIDAVMRDALSAFVEPTYLHQVVARDAAGALTRYVDLPEALARGVVSDGEEWRVHFHVPIFLAELTPSLRRFHTTQDFLAEILAHHANDPISPHLEVETYTWDVLPDELRDAPIADAIARELNWVARRLY
ncbi:MAG: metabolite traffic protein EboE [Rhodobacteraceae bacterium]|nr:metabolite traffic protein EboE [Paracoccaceae bacterium]